MMILQDPTSLTKRLKSAAKKSFTVQVRFEGFVFRSQLPPLHIKQKQLVWSRQVALCVDDDVWVEAETIIPLTSLQGRARQLLYIKNRSLGEVLFSDPHLKRSPFLIQQNTRSSVFYFYQQPLLVTETFLPQAMEYFSHCEENCHVIQRSFF